MNKTKINIIRIDKEPFLDMFNVFDEMSLKGMPLVAALSAIVTKAQEVYKNVKINTDVKKIPSYRYENGRFVKVLAEEDHVISAIDRSLDEFDLYNAIQNLEALTNFYKNAYYHAKIYEYFFEYVMKLLKKFNEINDLIKNHEKIAFEVEHLREENVKLQKEAETATSKMQLAERQLLMYSKQWKNLFANEKVLKFFLSNVNRLTQKNSLSFTSMQLVVMILYEGRMSIADICRTFTMDKKQFKEMLNNYPDLFVVIDNEFVDLNYKHEEISRAKVMEEIDNFTRKLGLDKVEIIENTKSEETENDTRRTSREQSETDKTDN